MMEGYLWKKGGLLSSMQRRYCVLKGTMLAYYTNEDEYKRHATPRAVLEVVAVREWDGASALKTYKHALEIDYLGGATYQCHCDSSEDKELWLQAIRHALDEPDRIMQDEIEDAQQQLLTDAETEEQALAQAADAVRTAQKLGQDALSYEQSMKDNATERHALEEKLAHTKVLLEEAAKKVNETRQALARARESAHDAALHADARSDNDDDDEARAGEDELDGARPRRSSSASPRRRAASLATDAAERVARLAAQLEVDSTLEETHKRDVAALDQRVIDLSRDYAELFRKSRECAEQSQSLRSSAASSLQQAQSAKQLAKLRIESWTTSASHLDPLADGYLLCKHPYKPTMHRRYYVLFGNTLCWYKDADTYAALADSPAGVVHVSGVTDWNGKAGGMKVLPHAFSIVTVEGKVLCCSAPTRQSATTWTTALHIGITMPPLSPHRAVAAKSRRDSFDLMSSMAALSPRKKGGTGHFQFPSQGGDNGSASDSTGAAGASAASQDADANVDASAPASREALEAAVVVEGYLVKKSAFVPVMKKKYCVLKGLRLYLFDSHDAYASSSATHDEIQVCSVSDWDGHGALLHYHYGFQIETLRHQAIYCSAANNEEKDKWVHGIRASLLKHRERLLSPTRREDSMIDRARKRLLRRALEQAGDAGDGTGTQLQELDESAAAHDEFLALLHEFYAEHNASKLSDVPMLVDRYVQRERALVEHLDRIYGTALAQDAHVVALLDRLAATKQQQPLARRKSSGVTSGLVDFVKMAGYLAWNAERCYCILSINKLVRYRTQTQYETTPYDPMDAIVIASVYEYPPPPDFVPSASAKNTFFVSYYPSELEDAPHSAAPAPSSPAQLALSAATVDEKLQWMAKIRSGLGFVHASAAAPRSTSSGHDAADASASSSSSHDALRRKLIAYYKEHNARKVGEVETLLVYFAGNELELLRDLDATYGTSIASDPDVVALVPTAAARDTSSASAAQYESYLHVKHPALGLAFQRCYCVLRDETWSCYRSSRDAHADSSSSNRGEDDASSDAMSDSSSASQQQAATPLLVDVVTGLHTQLESNQTLSASFSIETLANGPVLLRADVDKLAQDWTRVLRRAVDAYQRDEQARELDQAQSSESEARRRTSSVLVVPVDGPLRQLYDLLVAFYELHNRDKVAEVGTLLHAFRGRERALLEQIDRIYHSSLSADATFTAVLEDVAAHHDAQQRLRSSADDPTADAGVSDADAQEHAILMEGYLVKRGHLMPSMRKRYCVLVKTTLTYYATHEDSRNPSVAPHGRFQVDVVSDWSGKTATKTYDHGLELETVDGKTFFCAAYSAEDKAKWLRAFKHGLAIARAEQSSSGSAAAAPGSGDHDADGDGENGDGDSESKADRLARKAQFKDRLVQFYRETNPKKLADLDLLLSCYTQREFALLEAIDAAYGSALAHDPSLLALVPPSSAHTRALAALQYDGSLVRCSDSAWKRAQSVYVALNGLVLTFYASREGFKSSGSGGSAAGTASGSSVTLLAVKDVVSDSSGAATGRPVYRFAVETTEHVWVYLEAPNSVEKRHWLQLLHAALDTILAQSLLEEELAILQSSDARRTSKPGLLRRDSSFAPAALAGDSGWKGFLLVRMDFASEAEHMKKRECAVAMEERHFVLHKHNQLVVYNDVQDAIVATFTTLSTRAWEPSATGSGAAPIVMRGDSKCRFPFQIVTLEQIVLSCSAASDLLRAKWIKQIRAGAERAAALELLQDQQRQAQLEGASAAASANAGGEIIVAPASEASLSLASGSATDATRDGAVAMQGYLDYKVTESAAVPPASSLATEGYFVLTTRADVDVYADEGAFYRRDAPLLTVQAVELLDPLLVPPPLSPSSPTRRHLHKLFGENASASSRVFSVQTKDKRAPFVHIFAASAALHERWLSAFRTSIDLVKGEELLADEKLILRLEETNAEATAKQHDDAVSASGDAAAGALVASTTPGVVLEGSLTPWRLTFSSPRPTATAPLYYVLVGCRLRGFASQSEITGALSTTRAERDHSSVLDVDVVSVSDWDAPPSATATVSSQTSMDEIEGVGFQIEVVVPPSQSRETLYFTAPSSARKHAWVCGLKRELDFALAELYLDDDAREFARQVAAHVADTNGGRLNQSGDASQPHAHVEGYVRVRHHFLGALWRERYAVLDDARLLLFSDASGAQSADRERSAVEKHDLVAVEKWHPTYSASLGSHSASRVGFRVENEAGGYLECTVSSQDEQTQWLSAIIAAVDALSTHMSSTRVMQRDAALPFIPGAAMEGYLKTKEPKHTKLFWKTRYCVVIGTQWLLYETQAQAAGGASGDDASVPPLAVYEIAQVESWTLADQNADHRSLLDAGDELAARAFSVHASTGVRVDCKAQSSLERKRWLNAMEDEVAKAASESAQFVDAIEQHRAKESAKAAIKTKYNEVQSEAKRQSAYLREALQLAGLDDMNDCGSSSSGSSEYSDDNDDNNGGDGAATTDADGGDRERGAQRLRLRSGSDFIDRSPEWSPIRPKTSGAVASFGDDDDDADGDHAKKQQRFGAVPLASSLVACFTRCFARPQDASGVKSVNGSGSSGKAPVRAGRSIAPLGVPGFPANADVWTRMYTCEYYTDDGYTSADSDA